MIGEHRAKESHTSIHLCQVGEGRAGEKRGLDGGVQGAANGASNHILYRGIFWMGMLGGCCLHASRCVRLLL